MIITRPISGPPIDQTTNEWKHSLLLNLVAPSDIAHIKSIKLTRSPRPNAFVWTLTKSGVYSVKTAYNLAIENMEPNDAAPVIEPSTTGLKSQSLETPNDQENSALHMASRIQLCTGMQLPS
ncbi:Uncharacterized protein Rs2_07930 [Raphanus sativus]|nr:Uncharacterized protein Rs2_07930 [Raphanus sativus]